MCECDEESVDHMLLHFSVAQEMRSMLFGLCLGVFWVGKVILADIGT